MSERILLTGGAGCLGSNLVERLIPEGHEVLVIDNFATGKREVLPAVDGLEVAEGSIADAALVDRCFDAFRPTLVIHSAAAYKDPDDWAEDARTNVQGTINVVAASARHAVRRIINFQTALCYGRPLTVPIPVDHPTRPFTSYGVSKLAGEQYLAMSPVPWVSLRLANVTGPRLAIGPIPTFYKRLGEGKSCFCSDTSRDFLDMEDFLSLMALLMQDTVPSGVYNISTGEGHTIKEIFDLVVEHLDVTLEAPVPVVPPEADDVPAVVLDPSASERRLGWRAQVSFEETIRRMLRWYDAHGVSDVYSHLKPAATTEGAC
jgi:nucleoside-diphosphate-sugar epimerase